MPDVTITLTEFEARALCRAGSFAASVFADALDGHEASDGPIAVETAPMKLEVAMVAEGVAE